MYIRLMQSWLLHGIGVCEEEGDSLWGRSARGAPPLFTVWTPYEAHPVCLEREGIPNDDASMLTAADGREEMRPKVEQART